MSRKGAKSGSTRPTSRADENRDETFQAVVLTDTFESTFNPFSVERPRCLLPLANTPLIEYTFEFLANAGVRDVIVYGGAHHDQVEAHIRKSRWRLPSSPFRRMEIIRCAARSTGDVMRDLDGRDIITGDFVVVSGDIVSNMPLEAALSEHRARRKANRNAIMTMILREAGPRHRTKAHRPSPVFMIDPVHDRCLHYEEMDPLRGRPYVNVDPDFLQTQSEIDVRSDLIDCRIDICTADVLALWTDSFDYESPRKHFLHGVLKDHELNGKTIHVHIVRGRYAARLGDLLAYDAVSQDIVSRWAYPIGPDSNLVPGQSYRFQRGNIYLEEGVVLAQSSVIHRQTVIGEGTTIGDNTTIRRSIIGRRCRIGRNVTIDGAYIWDDVVISERSEVRRAIIADHATLGPGSIIEPGALLSFRTRIGDGVRVPGASRIIHRPLNSSSGPSPPEDGVANHSSSDDPFLVGEGGRGCAFVDPDVDVQGREVYDPDEHALSDSSISTLRSDDELYPPVRHRRPSSTGSFTSHQSDGGPDSSFHHDAASSIFDALQRDEGSDIVQIELQGLRLGVDADYQQVRRAIIAAFVKRIEQLVDQQTSLGGVRGAVDHILRSYHVVFAKTIFDHDQDVKTDQVDFLLSLQRHLVHRGLGESLLLSMTKDLYKLDVLDEDGLNQWWQAEASTADADMRRVRALTQQFIDWLANAEEDTSSSSSSGAGGGGGNSEEAGDDA